MRVTPTAANVLEYAAIVRDRALLRRLGETADEINNMVYEGSGEADTMLEAAERKIYALRQGRTVGGLMPISMVVQTVFDRLSEAAGLRQQDPRPAVRDFHDLDRTILGLNKSELILDRRAPRHGQDEYRAEYRAQRRHDAEKDRGDILARNVAASSSCRDCCRARRWLPSQNLLTGQLSEQQWRDIADAAQTLSAVGHQDRRQPDA